MYLKSLHIQNFRCFADYTIEFAPGVTVLFGKNGAGKTTLIHAMHKALSFMMHSEKVKAKDPKTKKQVPVGEKSIRSGNPYVSVEGFSLMGDVHYEGTKRSDYLMEISATAELNNQTPLEWAISAYAINCRLRPSEYKQAFQTLYDWHLSAKELPLLAYYSDSFPHVAMSISKDKKEQSKEAYHVKNNYPELGYTEWNSDKGFTNTWIERLKSKLYFITDLPHELDSLKENLAAGHISQEDYNNQAEQIIKELNSAQQELSAITACLQKFFSGDKYYEIISLNLGRYRRTELYYLTSSGKRGSIRELPAGYERLVYIVLDIAYRSYLLGGLTSTDISGIAIIDEIDLHLHPQLEQVVLQRFMKTFPHVQFIVSTHSPLVLSGLETEGKPNKILRMVPDTTAPEDLHDIYGLDVNSSIEDAMGVSSKNDELDELITLCAYMRSRGKLAQSENIKQRILSQFPKNSEELEKLIIYKQKEL